MFALLSRCLGMLFSAVKRSASDRAFFNAIRYLSVLGNLKLLCFALRSPVMITLSANIFMLFSSVIFIVDAGGI